LIWALVITSVVVAVAAAADMSAATVAAMMTLFNFFPLPSDCVLTLGGFQQAATGVRRPG
jgi:hypothetical protein